MISERVAWPHGHRLIGVTGPQMTQLAHGCPFPQQTLPCLLADPMGPRFLRPRHTFSFFPFPLPPSLLLSFLPVFPLSLLTMSFSSFLAFLLLSFFDPVLMTHSVSLFCSVPRVHRYNNNTIIVGPAPEELTTQDICA